MELRHTQSRMLRAAANADLIAGHFKEINHSLMGPDRGRSRSATTAAQRPPSRESTTSMHSAQTQFHPNDMAAVPPQQQQQIHQQAMQAVYHDVTADNMAALLQAAPEFGVQHGLKYDMATGMHQHGQPVHAVANGYYAPSTTQPFAQGQAVLPHQSLAYSNQFNTLRSASLPPQDAATFKMEDQARKPPSATATNDRELRELLNRNRGRALPDVASEVIATERTSKSERTKQLFAMLWLEANTKPAKTSVPRSRVYHTYASRCATERVQPLNPASFGKLVRVIWPGIATRRLGVRGESKYHYVDLCLVNDPQENSQSSRQRLLSVTSKTAEPPIIDFKYVELRHSDSGFQSKSQLANCASSSMPQLRTDTAVLQPDDQSLDSPLFGSTTHNLPPAAESRVFTDYHTPGLHSDALPTASSYEQYLAFTTLDTAPPNKNDPIVLPDIFDYAPPKTDVDAAGALVALYKTHITSLIDCVRYCKEKQFFRLFTTIQGTMTVPVHKLFVHADIAPWIRECDWLMYQKMIRCVANLTLQVVPPVVVKFLDTVQRSLHAHIATTFHGVPHHVLEAKLEPAALFASLLHRMLRVNQAAHAAANVLESRQIRDVMWRDFVRVVNPKRILESELPGCGYEAAYTVLTRDVRQLLEPLSVDPFAEAGTHYEAAALESATSASASAFDAPTSSAPTESIVDRIAAFLTSLPPQFPRASPRRLVDAVALIGDAIVREMVIGAALSYNSWLITHIFVSEMAMWLACLGGFLEHRPRGPVAAGARSGDETPEGVSIGCNGGAGAGSVASGAGSASGIPDADMKAEDDGAFPFSCSIAAPMTVPLRLSAGQHHSHTSADHSASLDAAASFAASALQSPFSPFNPSSNIVAAKMAAAAADDMDLHDDSGIGMGLLDDVADADAKMDAGFVVVDL